MPTIIDGKQIAAKVRAEVAEAVKALTARGLVPGLTVVRVGDDPASAIYVRGKRKDCEEVGIRSDEHHLPATTTQADLMALVARLNADRKVHGILVQLPLPRQVDTKRILLAVAPAKDVDGFHPCNVGNLVAGLPGPRACTPAGIIEILKRYGIPIAGKRTVVVGRSDIVGKPVAMLLLHEHATVTICHSKTPDLPAVCLEADILVAAMGRPAMITGEYIKPGATVIDVGTTRVEDASEARRIFAKAPDRLATFEKKGNVLVGDVHPVEVVAVAGAYTPVPGGVGPLTIAMLMANTVSAAERRAGVC